MRFQQPDSTKPGAHRSPGRVGRVPVSAATVDGSFARGRLHLIAQTDTLES